MVNEDNRYSTTGSKRNTKDQFAIMEHSINKRIKNDFKDDVKCFCEKMTRPCLVLKAMSPEERKPYLRSYFEKINHWFHHRRSSEGSPTVKGMKLLHGFAMPFESDRKSNLIVRVERDEFIVFETKERSPYMCVLETIE
jgi:hypothetical protein